MTNKETIREEILKELRKLILATKDLAGDYHIDIGSGSIKFVIHQNFKSDPDAKIILAEALELKERVWMKETAEYLSSIFDVPFEDAEIALKIALKNLAKK